MSILNLFCFLCVSVAAFWVFDLMNHESENRATDDVRRQNRDKIQHVSHRMKMKYISIAENFENSSHAARKWHTMNAAKEISFAVMRSLFLAAVKRKFNLVANYCVNKLACARRKLKMR